MCVEWRFKISLRISTLWFLFSAWRKVGPLATYVTPIEDWSDCVDSGRVLDSRQRGRWFEPHRRHCVVVLKQDTFILVSTGSTQEDLSLFNWKIVDGSLRIKSNKKQTNKRLCGCAGWSESSMDAHANLYLLHTYSFYPPMNTYNRTNFFLFHITFINISQFPQSNCCPISTITWVKVFRIIP